MCNDCITTFCLSGPLKFTTFVVIFVKLNMILCTFLYHRCKGTWRHFGRGLPRSLRFSFERKTILTICHCSSCFLFSTQVCDWFHHVSFIL
uniref:Uncharacterized protein n=1 Tax=Helianthus annuus TaxID=4232 RepID=A0A251URV8_HELAN